MNEVTPGLKGIKSIQDFEIEGKRVFLRLDLNVPLEDGKITDDTRIREALPTIEYCLEKKAKLILSSHLGRPKGFDKKYSLEPVAERLRELLSEKNPNIEIQLIEEPTSDATGILLKTLLSNQIILLENIRFLEGELKNDEKLAQELASLTDIYINDAFGASHREHATISALPKLVSKKGIGFLMQKEVQMLDEILYHAKSPLVAVLGGSKVSDKIGVLERLLDRVDTFIIGGAMAYTFLAAENHSVGKSKLESDKIRFSKEFIQKVKARDKKILLPIDHICVIQDNESPVSIDSPSIPDHLMALDIGPKTCKIFSKEIQNAQSVFWNGPMGMFEKKDFSKGTFAIAKAISENPGFTIVGGGDSVSALHHSGYDSHITHISTGGGASLEYLQGDQLVGLKVLRGRF